MAVIKNSPTICHALRYALPTFAAVWLMWTMLDIKWMEGWYEGQDGALHRATASFHLPTVELSIATAVLIASFLSAVTGRGRIGAALAMGSLVITELLWIAMTR